MLPGALRNSASRSTRAFLSSSRLAFVIASCPRASPWAAFFQTSKASLPVRLLTGRGKSSSKSCKQYVSSIGACGSVCNRLDALLTPLGVNAACCSAWLSMTRSRRGENLRQQGRGQRKAAMCSRCYSRTDATVYQSAREICALSDADGGDHVEIQRSRGMRGHLPCHGWMHEPLLHS